MVVADVDAVTVWSFEKLSISHSNGVITMTAPHIVDPATVLGEVLTDASPDLIRHLPQTMINALRCANANANANAVAGAGWGPPSGLTLFWRSGRCESRRVARLLGQED